MATKSSSQLLVFSNPGEIDPRLITTLGVNVKEGESPIGYFGTGLKYALAVALRLGCRVDIQSGLRTYTFSKQPTVIRGKEFELIAMAVDGEAPSTLGFTTDLGKNWEPWMAFRELECNAIDEGGSCRLEWEAPEPTEGQTRVVVAGAPLVEEYWRRGRWRLEEGRPLAESEGAAAFPQRADRAVFYRGIKVMEATKPPLFTYNLKAEARLTEDRTLAGTFGLQREVAFLWAEECQDEKLLEKVLRPSKGSWEEDLNWHWTSIRPSELWLKVIRRLVALHPTTVNASAVGIARRVAPEMFEEEREEVELTAVEEKTLARAVQFLAKSLRIRLEHQVKVVETLGEYEILGMAKDGVIWLSRGALSRGTKTVAGTLLEEHLHLSQGLDDFSRSMQNWLIDRLVSAGEELQGEPL